MVETLTEVTANTVRPSASITPPAPMCPCGKSMGLNKETQSWRCLACNPIPMDAPTCATQKCLRPLTRLGDPWNCWRCLVCNPIRKVKPTEKPKKKYIDVTMTDVIVREIIKEELQSLSKDTIDEEKIREIVVDEMANWHIQKPPATRDEITEAVGVGGDSFISTVNISEEINLSPPAWRKQAKELGIPLNKETGGSRRKIDVLADIEAAEKTEKVETDGLQEELRTEEQAGSGWR